MVSLRRSNYPTTYKKSWEKLETLSIDVRNKDRKANTLKIYQQTRSQNKKRLVDRLIR